MRRPRHLEGELVTSRRGVFWVGDETVSLPQGTVPRGQMFVQWEAPATVTKPYPIVLVHGGGGQGTDWLGTPDGRPGWATFLLQDGIRGLRRRPARTRPRALPPGCARADGQPALDRARLPALHERRRLAGGASHRRPPHRVAGERRPGRSVRAPVRRRDRSDARGPSRRARRGTRTRRSIVGRHRAGDPDDRVSRRPDGLADGRCAPVARRGDRHPRAARSPISCRQRLLTRLGTHRRTDDLRPSCRVSRRVAHDRRGSVGPPGRSRRGRCRRSPASRSRSSRPRRPCSPSPVPPRRHSWSTPAVASIGSRSPSTASTGTGT